MDILILVNKLHPLPENFQVRLAEAENGKLLEYSAAGAYKAMKNSAAAEGVFFKLLSGYRSVGYQKKLWEENVRRLELSGMSHRQAQKLTGESIAPPGVSEHHTGLAADIVRPEDTDAELSFHGTKQFLWLRENSHRFGFILRYPQDRSSLTGYSYEPWHYRFVGKAAEKIKNSGKTLEEYLTLCKKCGIINDI